MKIAIMVIVGIVCFIGLTVLKTSTEVFFLTGWILGGLTFFILEEA